jgi:hypothetical protein
MDVEIIQYWCYRTDHLPEIDIDKVNKITGMDIVCDHRTHQRRSVRIAEGTGMPFNKARLNQSIAPHATMR